MKIKYIIPIILLLLISCAKNTIHYHKEPFIKVAVLHKANKITISSTSDYYIKSSNGVLKLSKNNEVIFYKGIEPNVYIDGKKKIKKLYYTVKIIPKGGILNVNGRMYRGELWVMKDADNYLLVVNYLPIEKYLMGVVPSEIGHLNKDKIEASKAQAVAARTYAISHFKKHYDMGYDIECTVADQVYNGVSAEDKITNKAIIQTRGIVALYDNKPIDAKYHSTCGGYTANNEDEWGGAPVPYLRGVEDASGCLFFKHYYCEDSKHFSWAHKFKKKDFYILVSRNFSDMKGRKIKIKSVKIKNTDKYGRVKSIELKSDKGKKYIIKGLDIRKIFKGVNAPGNILRSRLFKIKKHFNTITIEGKGFGHGVGMCQYGAMGMAEDGKNYKEILKHYYKGIQLKKLY